MKLFTYHKNIGWLLRIIW